MSTAFHFPSGVPAALLYNRGCQAVARYSALGGEAPRFASAWSGFQSGPREALSRVAAPHSLSPMGGLLSKPGARSLQSSATPSALEREVRDTIASNPVVVYSKSWCGFSHQVKALFRELKVPAKVIELDELGADGDAMQTALHQMTGQRTVPNVFIGGRHVGGCMETLEEYDSGTLQKRLQVALEGK
ncbi:hypothetical protein CDCA_CDCA01G0441 [Cyanidium caldarium]|uniref:Glutaredoxin domain-containing protein n=1 Tax=Cyanidium caldarium TaxID=2771 RepID=A0AAV9IQS2_CYACA|nr:hypothetical protein CDCA_CDCA01G0441 [Cyanidium caldarium]